MWTRRAGPAWWTWARSRSQCAPRSPRERSGCRGKRFGSSPGSRGPRGGGGGGGARVGRGGGRGGGGGDGAPDGGVGRVADGLRHGEGRRPRHGDRKGAVAGEDRRHARRLAARRGRLMGA